MRILYLAHYYFPYMSSASLITHDIISRLQKRHDITLVVPYSPGVMISAAPSGVVIGRRPSHGKFPASPTKRLEFATLHYAGNLFPFEVSVFSEGLSLAVEAVNICKERTFDLILCQYHPANLASLGGLLAGKLLKIPCILRTEDLLLGSTLRLATRIHAYSALFFNRSAVNGCNVVLTQSSEFHELIRSYYGRKGATRISPNGVDTRMFSPEVSASSLREALELKNVKVILYVGSLSADYGLDRGIMALRAIVRKMQNVALVVVGDGPDRVRFHQLSVDLGVDSHVRWVGSVPYSEVPRYMSIADICLGTLRSRIENYGTIPTKVLQYMSSGKPVICSYNGVSKDLLIDSHTGVVYRRGVDELADKLLTLLQQDDYSRELGTNAREHVRQKYDWDLVVDGLDENLSASLTAD